MKTVFCNCRMCKLYRHTRSAAASARRAKKHVRNHNRMALHRGDYLNLLDKALAGYRA